MGDCEGNLNKEATLKEILAPLTHLRRPRFRTLSAFARCTISFLGRLGLYHLVKGPTDLLFTRVAPWLESLYS